MFKSVVQEYHASVSCTVDLIRVRTFVKIIEIIDTDHTIEQLMKVNVASCYSIYKWSTFLQIFTRPFNNNLTVCPTVSQSYKKFEKKPTWHVVVNTRY